MTDAPTPDHPLKRDPPHWLVRPATIGWMWRVGVILLLILTALDFVIEPHPYFGLDGTFGFHSWYGFATCAAMVVAAKLLGLFLKRPDTYYDEDGAS